MIVQLHPTMTVQQIADILDQNRGRDVECYIRIETIRGKPIGYLVREPRIPASHTPVFLRKQAE